ncbi:hypothetical protein QM306_37455, partial [Burkholderia cenocepacia]|nr:hypothetical protein [Burkholderia cenocepacia]
LRAALLPVSRGGEADGLAALVAVAETFVQSAEKAAAQKDSLDDRARHRPPDEAGAGDPNARPAAAPHRSTRRR